MRLRYQWVVLLLLAMPLSVSAADDGQTLFQNHCMACHTIGRGRLVGPDLAGVDTRRSQEWMTAFVQSSQGLIQKGDAEAKAIFEAYGQMIMPDQPLDDAQVAAVVAYIKGQGSAGAAGGAEAAVSETFTASKADVDRGLALFQGKVRFVNKGPTCNACHHVKNDAVIGGGVLAKELTTVFSRMHGAGVTAILGKAPFPVMEAAYAEKPLTDDEIHALVAFLQFADHEHFYQQPRDYGMRLFFTGLVGTVLLFGLYGGLWFRRKRRSVNHDIFQRQDEQLKRDE